MHRRHGYRIALDVARLPVNDGDHQTTGSTSASANRRPRRPGNCEASNSADARANQRIPKDRATGGSEHYERESGCQGKLPHQRFSPKRELSAAFPKL
jgi:hypothetical protein